MQRQILLFILISFSVGTLHAQQSLSAPANTTVSVSNTGSGIYYYADRNAPPRAIEFNERTLTASHFLTNINQYANIPNDFTFIEAESNTDDFGMQHRLLNQYYKGISLEGLGYRVHERNGFVTSMNGKAIRNIKVDTTTTIDDTYAFHLALQYLNSKDSVFRHGKKLIVSKNFVYTPESFSVAFQFDIDVSFIERWRVSIDARTGQLINKVSLVNNCFNEAAPPLPYATGTGLTNYYGSRTIQVEKLGEGSRLFGRTQNGGVIETYNFMNASIWGLFFGFYDVYEFYSGDNTYTSSYTKPAVSVQWAAEQAYEYYLIKHNRNSYDNNGAAIISYVHVDKDMNNAFWTGRVLAFGDGSNNNPLVELDVVSHELTHGVTQHEAGLNYYYESGALNESFSDIFGKAIEFNTFGDTATWQLARHYRDGGLRDFSNPNKKDQPDTYLGDLWFTGYEDSGGVHYNSGVQNFWYYLLCEGGSGVNDHQISYSVNAIGMEAATKIAYRNLTEYLGYLSDYFDSRIGSLLATKDLYGKNSTQYSEVDKAWDAVGVIDEPIVTSFELYDITATTVKIKGSLEPRGNEVTYHFDYGTTLAYGSSTPSYPYTDKIEAKISGLQSSTKYYIRLVATNENGNTLYTSSFTTIALAPLVKIEPTVDVTETTATFHGQINPNSLPTSFYFEYGLTPALGLVTPTYHLSGTTEFLDVSASVTNLQPRQKYYYRLVATNGFSSAITQALHFFTAVKPVITSFEPITAPIGTEITLAGTNFNVVAEKNVVRFGAVTASVVSATYTEVKVKVPAGASFGTLSLLDTESGMIAESVQEFVPTYTGEFKKGDLSLRVAYNDIDFHKVLVHDMDGDSKPDIVSAYYLGFVILQNVNQGGDITEESFVRSSYASDYNDGSLYLVDLDGNGLTDVVKGYEKGIRIYPNFSVPGYIFFGVPIEIPIGYVGNLMFNDFDGDGHVDIGGTYYTMGENSVIILRNQISKGAVMTADSFVKQYSKPWDYYVHYLTSGDLNNDGKPELMASTYDKNAVSIFVNNSEPGIFEFDESVAEDLTRGRIARYVATDLNRDGWKDLLSHSLYVGGALGILENKKNAAKNSFNNSVIVLSEGKQMSIQPTDMDGDGKVDMVVGDYDGKFIYLKNNTEAGEPFSESSFIRFEDYGENKNGSQNVDSQVIVNDLNGDGRPEVINSLGYSFYPYEGNQLEIWQNEPKNCIDPSLIKLTIFNYFVTLTLPANTTLDQYEIEYSPGNYPYWNQVNETTFYVYSGQGYKLRARAKCYLGYTDYFYWDFTTECVEINSFSIASVDVTTATLFAYELSTFEIEYSLADKNEWMPQLQYYDQILSLVPGTTYDLRFRGRCYSPSEFKYKQFTTLCPKLTSLVISDLQYNQATVSSKSMYDGKVLYEYSADNENWNEVDDTHIIHFLTPGKQYFVRGRMECTDSKAEFINSFFITPCPSVSALTVDMITPFSGRIKWVDEALTNNYVVAYTNQNGVIITAEVNSKSFTRDGLAPGTRYQVAVAPQCIGLKNFTSTTFNTVCYVPVNLVAYDITHTTAELSWSDNFSGVPYVVEYSIAGSNVWTTTETAPTDISLTKLRPGTEYEVRVHINCLNETAPYVSLHFKTELYAATTFDPNPTNYEITIRPSINLIGSRFSIYDNTGREAAAGELLEYSINLSDFSPGIYFLKIQGEKPMKIIKY